MKPKSVRATDAKADRNERDYLEEGLTEQEAAAFLGLSVRFLQNRRTRGGGPDYVGISRRCVRYRRRDLIAWSDARARAHTSETEATGKSVSESPGRSRRRPTTDPEAEERS